MVVAVAMEARTGKNLHHPLNSHSSKKHIDVVAAVVVMVAAVAARGSGMNNGTAQVE